MFEILMQAPLVVLRAQGASVSVSLWAQRRAESREIAFRPVPLVSTGLRQAPLVLQLKAPMYQSSVLGATPVFLFEGQELVFMPACAVNHES